jgi:outer membrane protein OmpA-like peptidoglycan-associated protein
MRIPLMVLVVWTAAASPVDAQVTLNRFRASETPDDGFQLSRPTDLGHLGIGAQLHLDYANDPLVYERTLGDSDTEDASVVAHQLTATLGFAFGLVDRVVLFAGLPVNLAVTGDDDTLGANEADGTGLGDAHLGARVRILGEGDDTIGLAGQLTLTFPTGGGSYRGDDFLSFHPELLFEARPEALRVLVNVGYRIRENQRLAGDVLVGDELTFGLGVAVPVLGNHRDPYADRVDVHAQIFGAATGGDFFGRESTPLEGSVGAKLHRPSGWVAGLAIGTGLSRGVGSPDVRVIATAGWRTPPEPPPEVGPADECPDEDEDEDGFQDEDGCPDPDNDGDGILDEDDRCPLEPGPPYNDGCPDPDTDEDGLPDSADECPEDPEDRDGFEDDDGCPDPDNDGDGVLDEPDRCPLAPGPAENEGCPDRDGDGVIDPIDNCPDEPGPASNQGCEEEQQVVIREDRLEILDTIYFDHDAAHIRRRSYRLLTNIAQVLQNHPEIEHIRIEGHTDNSGEHDYNMRLSDERAHAVRDFLIEKGVAAERLEAQGFGETRPLESNETDEGRATNRRVEFNLGLANEEE